MSAVQHVGPQNAPFGSLLVSSIDPSNVARTASDAIEGQRGGVYIQIVTMIVVSAILTILVNIFLRR